MTFATSPPAHLFNKTFNVQRDTPVADSSGSGASSWSSHLSGLKGRIQPMSGAESVRYGRESTRRMWRVYTSPGVDITEKDRVVFTDTSAGSSVTKTLDIQEVKVAQLSSVVLRLICQEDS